jgi:hypothetical protein
MSAQEGTYRKRVKKVITRFTEKYHFGQTDQNLLKDQIALSNQGANDGLSKMQGLDDVGALLRLLFNLLCVEMLQLRRRHRPNNL